MKLSGSCRYESFTKPIIHAALGVSGYVEFTSPIHRYSDLLAHYQVSDMWLYWKSQSTNEVACPYSWVLVSREEVVII
jgi:exoribonuclease R